MGPRVDLSAHLPSGARTPNPIPWAKFGIVGAVVLAAGAILYPIMFGDKPDFGRDTYTVERDALSLDPPPEVPTALYFNDQHKDGYAKGRGLKVTLVIQNDPRKGYGETSESFELPVAETTEIEPAPRKQLIKDKQVELEALAARFKQPIPVPRTIEIGIDITEGTALIENFVRDQLDELRVKEKMFASNKDPLRLFVFRIGATAFRETKIFEIAKESEVQDKYGKALNWLFTSSPPAEKSSIATGLFNDLEVDAEFRRREIIFFGDGMEHNKLGRQAFTLSFYDEPAALLLQNQADTIKRLKQVRPCPKLDHVDNFLWRVPPMMGRKVRNNERVFMQIKVLWEAVLNTCGVPDGKAKVIY